VDGVIPIDQAQGLPSPAQDQSDAADPAELARKAKRTAEFHRKGLDSRRLHDLTAEKYAIHVDGEGNAQWYDIFDGTRLRMTPTLNGFSPTQDNQLRPILDNFIAHLTTQSYRFVVEAKQDRVSRQAALVDQAIINSEVRSQKWNYLMAEAKMLAAVMGFCPIHSMWRDDPQDDAFENVMPGTMPGHIDSFVGNPFDHVFNSGAKRGSFHRQTWGRTLPADLVRQVFQRPDLEGNDRLPSASSFQRIVRKWVQLGADLHGHAQLSSSTSHEEMIALIYDEIMPGYDPNYPEGGLCIVALQGAATTTPGDAQSSIGKPVHLWSGPLPAGTFSSINVYSHHRFDDIHGKPYIGDIDDDQIELNQRLAILKDYQRRASKTPLGGSAGVTVDTIGFEADTFFEIDQQIGAGAATLQWLEYPGSHISTLLEEIGMIYERMYRKAGWQAASRGEIGGQSGKAIIALQQADDSIMGPIAQRTAEELEDLAVLNWRIRKEFMDAKTVLQYVGDELAHMAEPYVDRTMMSAIAPSFKLVSGFGTSTEAIAQQLLNLLSVTDTAGEPVLTTRQFKKKWPDQSLYHETDDPRDVRERRPRIVNELIRQAADRLTEQLQMQLMGQGAVDPQTGQSQWQPSMADPFTQQLGMICEMEVAQQEDVLMDDDMQLNVEVLSVITQDPTEHPVARRAAIMRQQRYFLWMSGQQEQLQAQQVQQQVAVTGGKQQIRDSANGTPGKEEAFNPAKEGETTSAQSMVQADKSFERQIA